jgi:iron complex transport system substrate-binding protein
MTVIKVPIKKIVVTSTTHIPMLELLNEEKSLVGFPHTEYISSPKTRALISKKNIIELGKEENINTELLLDLNPELVVGFSMSSNNKMFANIKKAGIPVILNGDWLEKTPLGRAEWIKFFGVLFNKEKQANSVFKNIEKQYNEAKNIAKLSKTIPKVLSGVMYKDKWNLPAGQSYGAQFLKDANVNYPWQETEGTGSLSLSFESVFDKAKNATIWISPGYFNSYQQLQEANQHYTKFDAFTNKKVFNFINRKGETGGVLYYELAPVQPHIVLKDIIKIVHPNLLEDYQPYYLEKLD